MTTPPSTTPVPVLEPVRNDIMEAVEIDAEWEAVAAAMGWLEEVERNG